jgi:thioesterase domain-containing protein
VQGPPRPLAGTALAGTALAGTVLAGTALSGPAPARPGASGWSIADRAWHYYTALRAQFPPGQWRWRLAGWSFGAWLAVAMAAQAEADGCPAQEVSLIDPPSPDAGSSLAGYDDAQLERVFAAELGHGAADRIGPPARDYAERLARCGRASLASMAGYSPPALDVTPARLWLAAQGTPGLPAPEPAPTRAQAWQTLLPGLVSWQALDTTHDGIVRPPCVHTIAAEISAVPQPVLWVG